jgi:hypothetical protein
MRAGHVGGKFRKKEENEWISKATTVTTRNIMLGSTTASAV